MKPSHCLFCPTNRQILSTMYTIVLLNMKPVSLMRICTFLGRRLSCCEASHNLVTVTSWIDQIVYSVTFHDLSLGFSSFMSNDYALSVMTGKQRCCLILKVTYKNRLGMWIFLRNKKSIVLKKDNLCCWNSIFCSVN